jgi:hypothetical protein
MSDDLHPQQHNTDKKKEVERLFAIDEFILWNQKQSSDAFIRQCGECVPEGNRGEGCIYDPYRKDFLHLDRHPSTGTLAVAAESSKLAKESTRLYLGQNGSSLRTVEVCGCFDHLHTRHQMLLKHAFWMAGSGLVVTVTESPSLCVEYAQEYQPLHVRIDAVKAFLTELNVKRGIKIVVLSDRERMKNIDDEIIDAQVWPSEYFGYFLARKAVFFHLSCERHSTHIREDIVEAKKLAEAQVCRKHGVYGP